MTLLRYVAVRLLLSIPVILGILLLNFFLIHLAPGDPAEILAGEFASKEAIQAIRTRYGLDQPLAVQLVTYLRRVMRGDLGFSYDYNQPVAAVVASRFPATILLLLSSQALGILLGITLGTLTAWAYGSRLDTMVSGAAAVAYSLPVFWLGLMMILVFGIWLRWLPTSGMTSILGPEEGAGYWVDVARHLAMPATSLALVWVAPVVLRITRAGVVEVLGEQFTMTARAKGLSEERVLFRHVLRNAMLPNLTIIGLNLSLAVSGSILTETVFGWPGMGRLMYEAMFKRDYPVIMGVFLITAVTVVLGTLVVDLLYRLFDPRIELR
ncbi:MAG: ABC transporter permease [Armatimonadetes bacterium]|nr:ABC transporter permease [Armatimonadota bacterium]